MKYFDFFNRGKAWARENNTTIEALLKEATDGKVTKNVYQGWRMRETLPSGEYCYDLAKHMGVSCDWLISGKDFEAKPSEKSGFVPGSGDFVPAGGNFAPAHQNFIPARISSIVSELSELDDQGLKIIAREVHLLSEHCEPLRKADATSQASGTGKAM